MRRLLPVVAEHADARQLLDGDLGLAGPSAPIRDACWPGLQRAFAEDDLAAGSDRDDHFRLERLVARNGPSAELVRDAGRALGVDVVEQHASSTRDKGSRGGAAVHSRADHRRVSVAAERLRREHRRGARA